MIVVATKNPGKARDIEHLLGNLVPLAALPDEAPDVEETGTTFEANALLKAHAAAALLGRPALGDDSGLEVDFLDGAPGVYSARYAGVEGDRQAADRANNEKLLAALAGVPPERRTARFRSVLAFVDGDTVIVATGTCEGRILDAPRGTGGFGYDPLFYCPELGQTFGEADIAEKARVSHRARAAADLLPRLRAHFEVAKSRGSR